MARKPKAYQKLAPRRGGVGSYISLWLAQDHVLQVEGTWITESYQRVWLRDVQGFFVRPSRESKWMIGVSLALLVLFTGLAVFVPGEDASVIFGVMAGMAAPVLLYGIFFARNCHVHVITAVQRTEWVNIARLGKARKVLARLEPLIREAQRDEGTEVAPMPAAALEPDAAGAEDVAPVSIPS